VEAEEGAEKVLAGAEGPGFVGAPAFRPVKLRQKKRALAPVQFANSRMNIGDPWKRAPGLKPGINPTSIAGLKSGAPTKPKSLPQNTFSASCLAGLI